LQQPELSYVVPLRRKGTGTNKRNAVFALPAGTVTELAWTTENTRQKVTTAVVVAWETRVARSKVYGFGGWGEEAAVTAGRRARQKYRERFGIETSYRQKNQGQGTTTKNSVAYRLLLLGLGLLLRQVWVRLTGLIARARQARPTAWIGDLPLLRLLDWLADALKARYKGHKAIDIQTLPRPTS